ncbi:YHS domain-containing protein [Prauserella muralis]|uniref:Uncharacterized protein n=1 Tax=Prauserella muralis TaxID=588067 RepID=A0A2V4B1A2_9PSEU|nr:YHS domain-containing protein [Prauserella muralis]PXY26925.1 hypothetical protein BAY60_10500 [Prauserella muralis]TWE23463.1 YHS domain-containing protein [Prauserella muralis]
MLFAEVLTPRGLLTREQRDRIGHRFVADLTGTGEDAAAPAEVLEAARALYHVVFREADDWYVAGRRAEQGCAQVIVRVAVPEGWREEMSGYVVTAFTATLADVLGDPGIYDAPRAMIHVTGVPDGGVGLFGKAMTANDLVRLITEPVRGAPVPADLPPGTGYDPVCGMRVPYQHAAAVAEHGGTTYAFCSNGCHEVFTEEHAA